MWDLECFIQWELVSSTMEDKVQEGMLGFWMMEDEDGGFVFNRGETEYQIYNTKFERVITSRVITNYKLKIWLIALNSYNSFKLKAQQRLLKLIIWINVNRAAPSSS